MISSIAQYYTLCITLIGTGILGIVAGALGSFALLRKQSLLGDAIAHAALPGIAIAFLYTHSKNPAILLLGGSISGLIGTLLMSIITHHSRLKKDAALGIILSVFFGIGLMLMTVIQKQPMANQSILNKFLFGNASTLLPQDIYIMGTVGAIIITCMLVFWKEFKLITFDPDFAHTLHYPVALLQSFLTTLLVLAIVIGLQTVGVILMSSMLIAPAAAAYQWTHRLESMALLASCIGALSGICGALLSSMITHLPTGPIIVVVLSVVVFGSVIINHIWNIPRYNAKGVTRDERKNNF